MNDIDNKKEELKKEYKALMEKYDFYVKGGKIHFSEKAKKYHKMFKENIFDYIFTANLRHIASIPFIYAMIIPAVFLDIFLVVYQYTCFTLYRIPFVKRSDYIIFDRRKLGYLNMIQKINCIYCSYVNGLFEYAVEVGGRTERYRCPIKHAQKNNGRHSQQKDFADYGDAEGFNKEFNNHKCFVKK